eukprot:366099-Chlamydomonas_euryale.AAC.9
MAAATRRESSDCSSSVASPFPKTSWHRILLPHANTRLWHASPPPPRPAPAAAVHTDGHAGVPQEGRQPAGTAADQREARQGGDVHQADSVRRCTRLQRGRGTATEEEGGDGERGIVGLTREHGEQQQRSRASHCESMHKWTSGGHWKTLSMRKRLWNWKTMSVHKSLIQACIDGRRVHSPSPSPFPTPAHSHPFCLPLPFPHPCPLAATSRRRTRLRPS